MPTTLGSWKGCICRDQNKQIYTVSLGGKVLDRLVDGGDLEDGVQVLHLEPDGPVHGPCGGDVLVELDGLELLEGGTGQVLEEGMLHAAFLGPSQAPGRAVFSLVSRGANSLRWRKMRLLQYLE